jgi:RNA polymerase sigma factor (sigma-70 family)
LFTLFYNKREGYFIDYLFVLQDFFTISCNISVTGAIIPAEMVGAMAKTNTDDLVLRAHTEVDALGQLYELYYERIFRFCVYRLFSKEAAEDVTSTVFLAVARSIRTFPGRTEEDFRNWLYAIAANNANAYIRKTSRRKELFEKAALMTAAGTNNDHDPQNLNWPRLYAAILKLKPKHQTIITLRFFENLEFEQIAKIINAREATVRMTLHRILKKLRNHLQAVIDGEA